MNRLVPLLKEEQELKIKAQNLNVTLNIPDYSQEGPVERAMVANTKGLKHSTTTKKGLNSLA